MFEMHRSSKIFQGGSEKVKIIEQFCDLQVFRYSHMPFRNFNFELTSLNNKTPADQRDIFRPKLFHNDINLRLKSSQCTVKMQEVRRK